jgi:hypothetical protein
MERVVPEIQDLIEAIKSEVAQDACSGPQWLSDEGMRVLENAHTLRTVEAGRLPSSQAALLDFLGRSWLECHGKAYDEVERLSAALARLPGR